MANTSSRTLRLLSLLQTRRYWPGEALAERLGVSVRTLRRDVDRLRELGYPVEAQRGVDGGYQLAAGAALPPLVVDDDEAVALAVGMQAAVNGAVAGIEEPAVRALTKVVQVMPPRLRRQVDALRAVTVPADWGPSTSAPAVDPEALIIVARACRDSERLRFDYTGAVTTAGSTGESSAEPTRDSRVGTPRRARPGANRRHVEPHRLVSLGRRWYLVAYDLDRHDWRTFRLDRLTAPGGTGARFRPREPPMSDAAEFVRAGIRQLRDRYEVEVDVSAPAEQVRDRVGRWATAEPQGPDRCRLRMSVDSLDWALLTLGVLGVDFHVIGPPELVERVRDWSARFGRATS